MTITVQVGADTVNFPDGTSPEKMQQVLAAQYGGPKVAPPPTPDTPLTDKLLGAYDKTVGSVADTMSSYSGLTVDEEETLGSDVEGYGSARQIEGPEALLQGAGAVVGGASSAVMDTALEAVPDVVKDKAGDLAGAAFEKVADTDLGKRGIELAKKGGKAWEGFKKAHPETAKTIGAALEVGLILAPAGKVGSKMVQKGKDQVTNTFAKKIAPVDQIAAGTGRAGKTVEEGLTRARTYKSSADDLDLAQRISEVPGTKANRTATYNQAKVDANVGVKARQLDSDIKKAGNPEINTESFLDDLGKTVEDFADSDAALTLSGNAVDNAQKIMWQAHKMINESDGTTLGLLNARRKLDKWINDNAGKAFDADEINGRNAAQKLIRNQINDAVHEAVPSVGVKDKLLDQHKLLTANDYLTDTMRSEGVDVFDRFVKNISKGHVGPVGAVTTASAIGGALGLTVGTGAAGAAGGAALYTALKAANSATRKRVLGSMIAAAEVTRADKLILIDMLQAEKENPTPPEK